MKSATIRDRDEANAPALGEGRSRWIKEGSGLDLPLHVASGMINLNEGFPGAGRRLECDRQSKVEVAAQSLVACYLHSSSEHIRRIQRTNDGGDWKSP